MNPTLIIEVLSDSTKNYDRGEKFEHYQTLPSLVEYLTIAQDRPHIELWTRHEDRWTLAEFGDLGKSVLLEWVGTTLPLSEIYAKVVFDH